MSEAELHALFDRLFPHGFAGVDVLDEIAPERWDRSPLLACFHPSIDRIFEERLRMHRNLDDLRRLGDRRDGSRTDFSSSEPTLEQVKKEYVPSAVQQIEEVTELVGLCLWDLFSDNQEVHRGGWPFGRHRVIPWGRRFHRRTPHSNRRPLF